MAHPVPPLLRFNIVKWQLILYFLRFPSLMVNTYLCYMWRQSMYVVIPLNVSYTAVLAMLIYGCMNDLYMLTWDIYTHGSFFAHPILQILISLALMFPLEFERKFMRGIRTIPAASGTPEMKFSLTLGPLTVTASLVISALILITTVVFWEKLESPSQWGHRTRDVRWTRIFGTKRPASDEARKVLRAMTQNIAAVILLSILAAHSAILIHGVIYEKFETREVWRVPGAHLPSFCNFTLVHDIVPDETWSLFTKRSSSADHVTSIVPSTAAACKHHYRDGPLISMCKLPEEDNTCRAAQADIFDIAMIANTNHPSSTPARIWLLDAELLPRDVLITKKYDHGIRFMPGYQLLGLVTHAERHVIQSYFGDMWGFEPKYKSYVMPSIDWMQRTPLGNESVAWVTLEFNTAKRYYGQDQNLIRVIEDYRKHTFLSALSYIGGLLFVLQGLHILCFGKPLFWGMFGSELLDPFGIFGSGSRALRKRMAARFGSDVESRTFSAEGLSLFLRDFVLDIGPLDKGDDDDEDSCVENEKETAAGETYDAIPVGDLEENRRSIHVGNV